MMRESPIGNQEPEIGNRTRWTVLGAVAALLLAATASPMFAQHDHAAMTAPKSTSAGGGQMV